MNKDQLRKLDGAKRDGVRANAERLAEKGNDAQKTAAQQVLADLDELESEDREALAKRVSEMDRSQQVLEAFRVRPPTESESKLIEAILQNPGSTLDRLNDELGYIKGWDMLFGSMCRDRHDYLWSGPYVEARNAQHYCGILCDTGKSDGRITFTLKPDVAEAFLAMGFRSGPKTS